MLQKISKFFLYASLFSILIVLPGTFFPFIGGKYYFFRICVEAALAFGFLWFAFEARSGEAEHRAKEVVKKPLFIAVSVFVLMYVLAAIFAYDPAAAMWSNFERGEGAFQMLHYYAFFALLVYFFREENDWRRFFGAAIISSVIMCLYGVIAAANPVGSFVGPYLSGGKLTQETFWGRLLDPAQRFQGSLGNPAYVAPVILFSLFYSLWLWLSKKWNERLGQNILWTTTVVFLGLFFVLSQTRGAFLGLVAAVGAYFAYLVFAHREWRKKGVIGLATLFLLGGILFSLRDNTAVQKIPGARLLKSFDVGEATAQTRFWTWGSAWKGIKERPLLGWGPENFSVVFDKYFDPRHFTPGLQSETWFDRAHSIVFDYLAETGFLGFGSWMGIFAVYFWSLWGFVKKHGSGLSVALQALLFALPIAYLTQGLVLFDVLPIYVNLFMVFAFAAFIFSSHTSPKSHERRS